MFLELVEAGTTTVGLIQNRKAIITSLKRLGRRLLKGKTTVLVFGDGGTGKTTLGQFLSGNLDTDVSLGGYNQSSELAAVELSGEVPGIVFVPPGQARYRPSTWDKLYKKLSDGTALGVINVVSWGFHATKLERGAHSVAEGPAAGYLARYLAYNREQEIEALRELVPHLKATPGKVWMVSLVTKQDLWWHDRANVRAHYESGAYSGLVASILKSKGEQFFQHDYRSISLIPMNLTMGDGSVLAETSSGYDQPLRMANLNHFVSLLNERVR